MSQAASVRPGYDWRACLIAIVVGLGVGTVAGLLVTRVVDSPLLLSAVVTVTGTSVSTWTYGRVAKKGARPIDHDDCNNNC